MAAPRGVDDQRTPQPTLHYPQAHHRRNPHCLADESRMSACSLVNGWTAHVRGASCGLRSSVMRVGPDSLKTPEPILGATAASPRGLNIRLAGAPPTVVRAESTADRREVRARRRRKCHSCANCGRSPHLLPDDGHAAAVRFWPGALFLEKHLALSPAVRHRGEDFSFATKPTSIHG